jgi:hypothetical protein
VLVKLDAVLFSSSSRMGIGVVIRNHIGTCLIACSQIVNEVTSLELAESLSIRCALFHVQDEGFNKMLQTVYMSFSA